MENKVNTTLSTVITNNTFDGINASVVFLSINALQYLNKYCKQNLMTSATTMWGRNHCVTTYFIG